MQIQSPYLRIKWFIDLFSVDTVFNKLVREKNYLNEEDVETLDNNKIKEFYYRYLWWPWQLFLICLSVFFMLFGIMVLLSAYSRNNPFLFIITFFSSNLIILLSIVMFIAFVFRIVKVLRRSDERIDEREKDI